MLAVDSSSVYIANPLEFLGLIQEYLRGEYCLQDFIDLFIRPSAGRQLIGVGKTICADLVYRRADWNRSLRFAVASSRLCQDV